MPSAQESKRQLLDDYILGEELGQGAYGVVYACARRGHKEDFLAVKMVDKAETPEKEIKKEAEILDKVSHPNIIKFHSVYYEKCFVCIVMDRYKGGDMINGMQLHWESSGRIPSEKVKHIKRQMAVSLEVLHSKDIVHRDIKGDNYLLDRPDILDLDCLVVCTDFGTATACKATERMKGAVGTKTYWSPEFYANEYGHKVDVFAMGVIVYGLLEGKFPFKDEEGARLKKPKLHADLDPNCVDFTRALLKKEDGRRASAAEAVVHPWVAKVAEKFEAVPSMRTTPRGNDDEEWKKDARERLNEGGPALVNRERRYELVDRLHNAKAREDGAPDISLHFLNSTFDIVARHNKKTNTYAWLPQADADKYKLPSASDGVEVSGTLPEDNADATAASTSALFDKAAIQQTLQNYNIDVSSFGKGEAKTFEQFLREVKTGASRLMIDAAEYKKMVRVVDVVLLRLSYKSSSSEKVYLVELGDKFADGRERKDLNRLPGTKKDPHENVRKVAGRILKDMLGMQDCKVLFDFGVKEEFEEEEQSKSYPGVLTVYRKLFLEGQVSVTDPTILKRVCASDRGKEYKFESSEKYTRVLKWCSEDECKAFKNPVQLRAPKTDFHMSGLVMAPIAINEAALRELLTKSGVDVSKFGEGTAKSLEELGIELANNEISLARNASGQIVRVVDVVALRLKRSDKEGEVLAQVKESFDGGQVVEKPKLPGAKKALHENQFQVAYRVLERTLQIDENCVNLNTEMVRVIEESVDSPSYPQLKTLYRKRIISGEVLKPNA